RQGHRVGAVAVLQHHQEAQWRDRGTQRARAGHPIPDYTTGNTTGTAPAHTAEPGYGEPCMIRIQLVDDEPNVLNSLRRLLRRQDWQVDAFSDVRSEERRGGKEGCSRRAGCSARVE